MEPEEGLIRHVEALRGIYANKGVELTDDEARALAHHLGKKPFRAALLCVVVILALLAFLILRFVK